MPVRFGRRSPCGSSMAARGLILRREACLVDFHWQRTQKPEHLPLFHTKTEIHIH